MASLNPLSQLAPSQTALGVEPQSHHDQPQNEEANRSDTPIVVWDSSELDETSSITNQRATSQPNDDLSYPRSHVDTGNIQLITQRTAEHTHNDDGELIINQVEPTPGHVADPYDADDEGNESDEGEDPEYSRLVPSPTEPIDTLPDPFLFGVGTQIIFLPWRPSRTANRRSSPLLYNTASPNVPLTDNRNADSPSSAREDTDQDSSSTASSIATLRAWFDLPSSTESESDSDSIEDGDEGSDEDDDGSLSYYTDGSGYDEADSGSVSGSDSDSDDGWLATIIAQVESELDSLLPGEFEELMGLDTEQEVGEEEGDTDGDVSDDDGEDEGAVWDLDQGWDEEEDDLPELVSLSEAERARMERIWMHGELYDGTVWATEAQLAVIRDVARLMEEASTRSWLEFIRTRLG